MSIRGEDVGADELEQARIHAQRLESSLVRHSELLRERVKELECLRAIARLFDRRDAEAAETLRGVAEALPRAWQYADIAQARIVVGEDVYATPGFRDTPWCQTSALLVGGELVGALTVCYVEERPDRYEGPFLKEERDLLDMVAQRLSGYIERRQNLENLLAYQQDLRRLASMLAVTEQRERRRIAEGLHDQIGQNLALASMRLTTAQQLARDPEATRAIEEARALVSEVIAQTRSLTFELCPPILYELGLGPALDWVGEQFEESYGYRVVVREHGPSVVLGDDVKAALFQAAREILVNAGRHGKATTVDVDLYNSDGGVELVVRDNGVGFDVGADAASTGDEGGFGLFSIRERLRFFGGALAIASVPGRGTTVRMVLPLNPGPGVEGVVW
jgi:signal transduction histidine kinase